jgi:alkanesulfonate monooxygenase SsuD/methylene tetrahydromethanopterin reductase-like flavin-dependent oxidoreductase (luciferase family)
VILTAPETEYEVVASALERHEHGLPESMDNRMQRLKFGVFDHMDDAGRGLARQYEERLQLAEACEADGFYAYHVAEHHGTPHGIASSPNLLLAAMAQRTTRLRFGPLVMLLNFYHPLRAFEEIAMLDQISGGRVEFGIGRGGSPVELGFFGVDAAEAQDRYIEMTDIILKAMAGGTLNYHGRHFDLQNVPISLAPVQLPHPPLWVGAMRPDTALWAADRGVNIACVGSAGDTRSITDAYRGRWKALAKPEAGMPLLGLVRRIVIADSDDEALALARPAYERWFDTFTHLARQRGLPFPPELPTSFDAAIRSGSLIAGTASTVRPLLTAQVAEAGISYLLCQIAFGNLPMNASLRTADAIASIMPQIAQAPAETILG